MSRRRVICAECETCGWRVESPPDDPGAVWLVEGAAKEHSAANPDHYVLGEHDRRRIPDVSGCRPNPPTGNVVVGPWPGASA